MEDAIDTLLKQSLIGRGYKMAFDYSVQTIKKMEAIFISEADTKIILKDGDKENFRRSCRIAGVDEDRIDDVYEQLHSRKALVKSSNSAEPFIIDLPNVVLPKQGPLAIDKTELYQAYKIIPIPTVKRKIEIEFKLRQILITIVNHPESFRKDILRLHKLNPSNNSLETLERIGFVKSIKFSSYKKGASFRGYYLTELGYEASGITPPNLKGKTSIIHYNTQRIIAAELSKKGYRTQIEMKMGEDHFIDVWAQKDETTVFFEVAVSDNVDGQLKNLRYDLKANPTRLIFVCLNKDIMKNIRRKIRAVHLSKTDKAKLEFHCISLYYAAHNKGATHVQ
jgi:hypothetical protein